MTYIAQCPTTAPSPLIPTLLTSVQIAVSLQYATFKAWREQRQLLRALESMPLAMRKDLGWPARETEQTSCNTR
jgi:hypothetical protein